MSVSTAPRVIGAAKVKALRARTTLGDKQIIAGRGGGARKAVVPRDCANDH
jgi:hypothetical protein